MFPTQDSNLRADALIERVLVDYAIAAVRRCRLHQRGLNDTYKVETADGAIYFLRVYRAGWRSRDAIDTELGMLQHLASRGVRVAVPVARHDGALLTPLDCAEGNRWAALFSAAPGPEVEFKAYTQEQASRYGEAAAAIHGAADSYRGPQMRPPLDLDMLLERPLALIRSAFAHRPGDIAYLDGLGRRLHDRIAGAVGLEAGFCHGDLHGLNAGYADGAFTIYDFDCCGWGYRAYDLAVFPWAFAIHENSPERIGRMARAYLGGYRRHRAIDAADLAAIPVFVPVRNLWLVGLHIGLTDRTGWVWLNDRYFDRALKFFRDWEADFLRRPGADWLVERVAARPDDVQSRSAPK